jgi:hypothetical protein
MIISTRSLLPVTILLSAVSCGDGATDLSVDRDTLVTELSASELHSVCVAALSEAVPFGSVPDAVEKGNGVTSGC